MAVSILILPKDTYPNNTAVHNRIDAWLHATGLQQHAKELHRKMDVIEQGYVHVIIQASFSECSVSYYSAKEQQIIAIKT